MADLGARVAALIETAFDEDVIQLARAVLPKVTGGTAVVVAEEGFRGALSKLLDLRCRQLADADAVIAESQI